MNELETIISLLPKLTAAELDELRVRTVTLRRFTPEGGGVDDATLVLETLASFLKRVGADFFSPEALKATNQFPSFKAKIPSIMRYLRGAKLEQVEQRYVLDLAFDLIYRYLSKWGYPVGPRSLMAQVHRIPDVLNNQFPGYAKAGLLRMIAKRA